MTPGLREADATNMMSPNYTLAPGAVTATSNHHKGQRRPLTTTEIATLYRMGKTELLWENKEDLVELCIAKLGGKRSDYKKSKKDLVQLLHDIVREMFSIYGAQSDYSLAVQGWHSGHKREKDQVQGKGKRKGGRIGRDH